MRLYHRYIILISITFGVTLLCLFFINAYLNYPYNETTFSRKKVIQVVEDMTISMTKDQCRFHSCFDLFQCKPSDDWKIKVYLYPMTHFQIGKNNKVMFSQLSYEYEEILRTIEESEYVTKNISEACIFMPPIDLLAENGIDLNMASAALNSLPSWKNGMNHLIFNFFPHLPLLETKSLNLQIGKAMVASANLMTTNNRQDFDVSIPVFNSLTALHPNNHVISVSAPRKWKLLITQLSIKLAHRHVLRKVEDSKEGVLMLRKCLGVPHNTLQHYKLCKDGLPFSYPNILKDGVFCLILPGVYYGTTLLLDVMMMGCIPVIAIDNFILPFQDVIDWNRISVRIGEHQLHDVMKILNRFSEDDIIEKRYQAFYMWQKYFSSIKNIVDTTFDIYNERIFINKKKSYEEWNGPFGRIFKEKLQPGANPPLFFPLSPAKEEGFTAIILTYNRVDMLFILMKELQKVPSLAKILVIWNNPYSDPNENEWPTLSKSWQLIRMKTNRLTNRFYPFKEIETEAVMAIDDDILMLTTDEIEFAYQAWLQFPDRLVGFPARVHITDSNELINGKRLKYKYESEWQNAVSMVLTGAAFYHKMYNHWFTYMLPFEIRDYIDEKMNCEDIGMNFLISNMTGKQPIKVSPRKRFKCAQCRGNDSLWSETSHFIKRSECLSEFTNQFGRMPLEPVEFRVDPVLFQEKVPLEMKAFPNLGTV